MLGWIYIWKDGFVNVYRIKIKFGDLWYHLLVSGPCKIDNHILERGIINRNTCSRQDKKWRELGEPDYKDYRDLNLLELSRIIFLRAPIEERKDRELEWNSLGEFYRRRLPKKVGFNIFWYPNCFAIQVPYLDLTFNIWRKLPRRDHKRKPKNLISWFDSAVPVSVRCYNSLSQPLGHYTVDLPSFVWWLEGEGENMSEVLLTEMFGNI